MTDRYVRSGDDEVVRGVIPANREPVSRGAARLELFEPSSVLRSPSRARRGLHDEARAEVLLWAARCEPPSNEDHETRGECGLKTTLYVRQK